MRCLLTTVRVSPGGGESRKSREIESAAVTIGRGTDQDLHVPDLHVALRHARLLDAGSGNFQLEVLSENGVVVNGRRRQDCRLAVGDAMELGETTITIERAPAGFDLALALRRRATAEGATQGLPEKPRHRGASAIRLMSWFLFLLILGVGLLDPLVSHFAPDKRSLAALSLPGLAIWLPGPMSAPHEYFGHECSTCHQHPFQPVADESCRSCHKDVALHLPGRPEDITDPAARGCESCHMEHGGAEELVMTSQRFCADCHVDSSAFTGRQSPAGPATDFGLEHQPFRVTLARLAAEGLETVRIPLAEARGSEQSNLQFPHDVHLDPEGVEAPEGEVVMSCDDCHRAERGGGLMIPIAFEAHCNSCHRLEFDLSAPDRQVPHGDPQAALDVLVDFYAQLALRGGSEEVPIAVLESAPAEQSLEWARKQATTAATALFEDRACMQCHEVARREKNDTISWTIEPVYVHSSWLPAAQFNHGSHEVAECEDCHGAGASSDSSDILLPDIDTCRTCHGGEAAVDAVQSTCVSCHRFHNPEHDPVDRAGSAHSGILSLKSSPDLEAPSRELRGMDPRRRRPGEDR